MSKHITVLIVALSLGSFGLARADAQTISMSAIPPVGAGLASNAIVATLGTGSHGGVTVHIESDDAMVALVSSDASSAGATSIDVFVPDGIPSMHFFVQGIVIGTATISATATGFTGASAVATIVEPALEINGLLPSINELAADDVFMVRVGVPNAGNTALGTPQVVRPGADDLLVTLDSSNPAAGQLVTASMVGASVPVLIAAGTSTSPPFVASGGVAFHPISPGVTVISASSPGFGATAAAARSVTVTQAEITLSGLGPVGLGLRHPGASVNLSGVLHGGVVIHVESSDPTIAQLTASPTTPSAPDIDLTIPPGVANATFYVVGQGMTGTVSIIATAPGFSSSSSPVDVVQPAVRIASLSSSINVLAPPDAFVAQVGVPLGPGLSLQVAAEENPDLQVTVASSDPAVAELITATDAGQTVLVTVAPGLAQSPPTLALGGVALRPLADGFTQVSVSIPGFVSVPQSAQTVVVTPAAVTMGTIPDVGAGLESNAIALSLSGPQHGGVTVHIQSSDPALALVSDEQTNAGMPSADVPVANGVTNALFYVHGPEGVTGTATILATVSGFVDASRDVNIVMPGVQIEQLASSFEQGDAPDPFIVRIGVPKPDNSVIAMPQAVRAGSAGLTATLSSSDPAVGGLQTNTESGSPVHVMIPAGASQSPTTVAGGGVQFAPYIPGGAVVSAAVSGFTATAAASVPVTVTGTVPTLVQTFASRWDAGRLGVIVTWQLSDPTGISGFDISRRDGGGSFGRLDGIAIERSPAGFAFFDGETVPGRTYTYHVDILEGGEPVASFETDVETPRLELSLLQNTPNPFNPATRIRFVVPERTRVTLEVFDVQGRHVATLRDTDMPAGLSEVTWNGRDDAGAAVSSGVYLYRLRAGTRALTRKMLLLK